jgi:hypothetical protein
VRFVGDIDNRPKHHNRWFGTQLGQPGIEPMQVNLPCNAVNGLLWRPITKEAGTTAGPQRAIDVSFLGTTRGYGKRSPGFFTNRHRQSAVRAIHDLPKSMIRKTDATGKIPLARYRDIMHASKIVVSPWGYGPLCVRDFEAALSGCTIIKPKHNVWATFPNPLQEHSVYDCAPDFSDLENVVDKSLSNWDQDFERNTINRLRLRQAADNPAIYFRAMASVFSSVASDRPVELEMTL